MARGENLPVCVAGLWAWNAAGALLMPFTGATWLHDTAAAFELLFCPLALLGIGCLSSRAQIIFFPKGFYRISKSLFSLCQSNLSLLITVVCHLAVFNVWGVFSSNTPVGNWGHGEKEQLVQDHTAGNWQSKELRPNPRHGSSYSFQARLTLNLTKQGHLVLVQCFLTIQLGNIFFLMLPPPSEFWRGYCLVHSWSLTQKTQCSCLHHCQLSICL